MRSRFRAGTTTNSAFAPHRRTGYFVQHVGTYLSIDTGKYPTAPRLAREVVKALF